MIYGTAVLKLIGVVTNYVQHVVSPLLNQVCAWFLRIASVRKCLYVCVCVYVCLRVSAPKAINN